jgi:alpha-ketoglutarate-dependent taurine dioxygenase
MQTQALKTANQDSYAPIQIKTLTPSGKGITISDRKASDLSVSEINALLARYHWIAFTKNPMTEEESIKLVSQFGTLTNNERRTQGVLKIDGSKEKEGEVLLGKGFLPLHRDGALMGTNVLMVGICCLAYNNVTFGGRTFVTDLETAMTVIPTAYLDTIRKNGIEGKPVDQYYLKAATSWHALPGIITVEGKDYLNIGLPYPKDEKPSWQVRIPNIDQEESDKILFDIADILMDEKYCYYHEWEVGDLLLFDNRKTLHGREAFSGQRSLANIQALVD